MSIIAPGTQRETTPEPGRGPDVVASRLAAARARRAQAGSPGVGTSGSDTPAAAPTAAPPPADGPAPLSSAQRRLWFLQQLDPTSAAYTIPVVWDLEGELDEERLRTAWQEVVAGTRCCARGSGRRTASRAWSSTRRPPTSGWHARRPTRWPTWSPRWRARSTSRASSRGGAPCCASGPRTGAW